jgi:hypothetical protein
MFRFAFAFLILGTSPTFAGPMIDFSNGYHGDLGTFTTTVDGVQVDAVGGNLYRWQTTAFNHVDAGFGILSPEDQINAAEPEIDKVGTHEFMRLSGRSMTGIWFTSVNNKANIDIYLSIYPAGSKLNVNGQNCHQKDGSPMYSCYVPFDVPQAYVWVTPGGGSADNYWVTWGVDTPVEPVPEPGSLSLFGIGLLTLARKLCRHGR